MANNVVENCPQTFKDWASRATLKCSNENTYHCVKDEFSSIVEVCTTPLWIQKGHCPIYNTGLKKIVSTECTDPNCPSEVYRSDAVYKYNCYQQFSTRITTENTRATIPAAPNVAPIVGPLIAVCVVALLLLVVVVVVIMIRRKRQSGFNGRENGCGDKNGAGEDGNRMESSPEESSLNNHRISGPAFWKTEDYLEKNVFTISKFYENAVGALDIYGCVTIVGPPGCGKTLTALQLASRKCGKDGGSQLYFCQALEEILTIAEKDSNAYIIVDDWLDKYLYFPSTLDSAIDCLNRAYVKYIKDIKIHLILTAQEDKWNRIRSILNGCYLFNEPHLLTMNSKIFSEIEKRNMVLRHFECLDIEEILEGQNSQKKIPANQAKDSANEETSNLIKKTTHVPKDTVDYFVKIRDEKEFSFPLEVDLICIHRRLLKSCNRFSNNRFEDFLTNFFDTWSNDTDTKEKRSFCILVFAALLGGEISQRDFSAQKTGAMYNKICREYACQSNANKSEQKEEGKDKPKQNEFIEQQRDRELLETNLRLKSCLYQGSKGQGCPCFVFQHSSLFRFVLLYIQKKKGEIFIIENATVEVLLNKCWLDVSSDDRKNNTLLKLEGSVIFSQKKFMPLAKRILSEMQNGERVPEWDKHVFLSNKKFLDALKSIDKSHVGDVV